MSLQTRLTELITAIGADIKALTSALDTKVPLARLVNGKALSGDISLTASDVGALSPNAGNTALSGLKTASFNSQPQIATTSGAITIDWSSAQNQKQAEPTGNITYTFTAPPGPCHLQLLINSDGVSTAQTINWPGSVVWIGATWAGVANKKAVINFWYDGTNYFAMGSNQV